MTMKDYDFLTSTMLKIVKNDSKQKELDTSLKEAKSKVKNVEVQISKLPETIKKSEKENPPEDNSYSTFINWASGNHNRIKVLREEIIELKEEKSQLMNSSVVEDLEEQKGQWLTLSGKTWAEDWQNTITGWWVIVMVAIVAIGKIITVWFDEDLGPVTLLFGSCGWLAITWTRMLKIKSFQKEIDQHESNIARIQQLIDSKQAMIKSNMDKITSKENDYNNRVKKYNESVKHLERTKEQLVRERQNLLKAITYVDKIKQQIIDNKNKTKSLLESVNHLVPYNEHI